MHKIEKIIFYSKYKMYEISVQKYTDAKVYTITAINRRLFWEECVIYKRD